jgi:hypothetical protein
MRLFLFFACVGGIGAWIGLQPMAECRDGRNCVVNVTIAGATTSEGYREFVKSVLVRDDIGAKQAIDAGLVVGLRQGTTVLVLETRVEMNRGLKSKWPFVIMRRVRVMDGDEHGKAVWMENAYLTPSRREAKK